MNRPIRKEKRSGRAAVRWVLVIVGWTFVLSMLMSLVTNAAIPRISVFPAVLILIFFIALGVFFDILGLSVATASEKSFHAMASGRVPGAVQSINLLRRAEKVTSFCNDVVGDVSGIVSGGAISVIAAKVTESNASGTLLMPIVFSALVASVTVGSKALGKSVAIRHNRKIVTLAGRFIYRLEVIRSKLKK